MFYFIIEFDGVAPEKIEQQRTLAGAGFGVVVTDPRLIAFSNLQIKLNKISFGFGFKIGVPEQ